MLKRLLGICIVAMLAIGCSDRSPEESGPDVREGDPESSPRLMGVPSEGRRVAEKWCVNCHLTSSDGAAGSDVAPTWASIAADSNKTDTYIRSFLTNTHGEMQGISLSRQQISDVIAYLRTLE